tara:strand:- start:340 stop:510 length:171 start_codon:yes stop_codon:yes gene_type:complete
MKGKLKEDHFTADGALYKGDKVTIHVLNQIPNTYQVETKDGKLYTVPQDKIMLDKK